MTEYDYEKALKLLIAVEADLRLGNHDDAHFYITEALSLLQVNTGQPDYDYFELAD